MTIKENENFNNISLYPLNINEKNLKKAGKSYHMNNRNNRFKNVLEIEREKLKIDKSFLVDKGHKNGQEVHVVTTNGIIFIYNFMKLFSCSQNALVTVLIARPNQVTRLYNACNLTPDKEIINKCFEHVKQGLNNC